MDRDSAAQPGNGTGPWSEIEWTGGGGKMDRTCCSVLAPRTRKLEDGSVSRSESAGEHRSRQAGRQVSECIRRSHGDLLLLFAREACVKLLFVGVNHAPVAFSATRLRFCRVLTICACACRALLLLMQHSWAGPGLNFAQWDNTATCPCAALPAS